MAEKYPYIPSTGRLRDFLARVPSWGTPDEVNGKWLEQVGFRGGAGRAVLPPLKFVGVIAKSGTPAEGWKALRKGKPGRAEFAGLVRAAYADLFATYPDAHRKDAEALNNFFRAQTDAAEGTQAKMVQTFKVFVEFGDFDAAPVTPEQSATSGASTGVPQAQQGPVARVPSATGGMTLHVDIQLQLPATSDSEVYEKLFAAMRKHLIDLTGK